MEEDPITEFEKMEAERVDAVGNPANGTPWLLMKSMDGEHTHEDMDDDDDDYDEAKKEAAYCGDETCEVCTRRFEKAKLTTKRRKALATSAFAIPEKRAYPIHDRSHAANALSRVSQFGTPEEKTRVRAAVARKYPGMGKPRKAKKATAPAQMTDRGPGMGPGGHMEQTEENHPVERTGPKKFDNRREGASDHAEHYDTEKPPEGEGYGDTAPDKALPKEEALSQTRENARKSESPGAEYPQASREVDLGGKRAGPSRDAEARALAASQGAKMKRQPKSGDSADQLAMERYARGAKDLLEKAVALVLEQNPEREVDLSPPVSQKALKQAYGLLTGLAQNVRLPYPSVELENMTQDELIALLDKRDRRAAKARKEARKAKKEKAAKKVAKKEAAKAERPEGEAAEAAKSAPLDVNAIADSVSQAVKSALEPVVGRVENLEQQPARPRPALNDLAGTVVPRGEMTKSEAEGKLASLEMAIKEEQAKPRLTQDAEKLQRLGNQLTIAKMTIAERQRLGRTS